MPSPPRLSAPLAMVVASLLFSLMGVCVKFASAHYASIEIVCYRGLVGMAAAALMVRWQGRTLKTKLPAMHFWRSLSGVCALALWFHALGGLPLATAMTLNYLSSVWMALFMIGGAVLLGSARVDGRLVATVLAGFLGVALVLRPSLGDQQGWFALAGLVSGILSAFAYLQVTTLGRAGEPEARVVFYFSMGGALLGALGMLHVGASPHTPSGVALLLAVGVLAAAAQTLMTRAYAIGRVLTNASLQYLGIVYSCVLGVLLFGDRLSWTALAGMALIIGAGIAATLLRSRHGSTDSALPADP